MSLSHVTIEEVARLADVSIATVSRVINNKDRVKPATRQRVLDAMESLNFFPKKSGSIFRTAPSCKVLLVCVPEFNNPFNTPILEGIQKAASIVNFNVLILQTKGYYADIQDFTGILKNYPVAGILIIAAVPHTELLDELTQHYPVVMCAEYAENYNISYTAVDNISSSKKAVNYLISTGRKKIGMLNSNLNFSYARLREKGYRQALEEAGLEINPSWISHVSTVDYKLALSNALYMLSLPNRPDALFTSSDVFAISAVNAAKQLHLNVPNDISIIGFDNIEFSTMVTPSITTVSQPCFQLGYQACELLIEKIDNPFTETKHIFLDTELIVRDSTVLVPHISNEHK